MSSFLFSCENATYAVSAEHAQLFAGHREVLSCTDGWEPGALNLAQACAMRFRTPLVHAETSRLLLDVEANQEECWSRFSNMLDEPTKRRLIERYWFSYRNQLHRRIRADLDRHGLSIHVMVHCDPDQREHVQLFVPESSLLAASLAEAWLKNLKRDDLRCRQSVGGRETDLSRELSASHDPECYCQIRLCVHQDFFLMGTPWRWSTIKKHLLDGLAMAASRVESALPR